MNTTLEYSCLMTIFIIHKLLKPMEDLADHVWSEKYKQTLFLNIVTYIKYIGSRSWLAAHPYMTNVKL